MKRRSGFNPKRKISPAGPLEESADLAKRASYSGNPEHKRFPGDYGLTPPASPRPGKTLCDAEGPFLKHLAQELLRSGLEKGMVSEQRRGEWPQNIWSVASEAPFEAQLENEATGSYHGYPMPQEDDFRDVVLEEWARR
jgi:hypothetical protein